MNFNKYDYYGKYKKDDFTIDIHEIRKKQKEKEELRLSIYKHISSRVFKKIKDVADSEGYYLMYELPEFIPGLPLYDMNECIIFLINSLKDKGFKSKYVNPYSVFIAWDRPRPLLREIPERLLITNGISSANTLKYKPIENHNTFGHFIPKRK